jgi:hypothetical protein
MKLQFLLAGIVAAGLFALAPDAVAHGGGVVAVTAEEAFTAGVVSGPFAAGAAFAEGVSEASTVGVSGTFTATGGFSAVIVFSVPVTVSMGTPGGGIGVIPIIGVIRITQITQITRAHTTVTMRTTAIRTTETAIRTTETVMLVLPLRRRFKPNSPGAATTEVPLTAS